MTAQSLKTFQLCQAAPDSWLSIGPTSPITATGGVPADGRPFSPLWVYTSNKNKSLNKVGLRMTEVLLHGQIMVLQK